MTPHDLPTPALVIDLDQLDFNVDTMATVRPGSALRSHVKAHKCTELARFAAVRSGSDSFCCATVREMVGMAEAGRWVSRRPEKRPYLTPGQARLLGLYFYFKRKGWI